MGWFRKRSSSGPLQLDEVFADYELPVFDSAVHEVLRRVRDDDSTAAEIASGLEVDPGMSARVLRLVNSAGFGLRQPVEDLSQAVQLVGRSALESLLITIAVRSSLPSKDRPGFSTRSFWHGAAQRAAIAARLAQGAESSERSLCWTGALLQDLAIPLLVDHLGDRYCELLRTCSEGDEPLHDLEREALGTDHAEIGQRICEAWGFPTRLSEEIGHHHEAPGEEAAPLRLVALLLPGKAGDAPEGIESLVAAAEPLGIEPEQCQERVEQGLEDAQQLSAVLL